MVTSFLRLIVLDSVSIGKFRAFEGKTKGRSSSDALIACL